MMEDNIPGFIGYHITKDGELYSKLYKILTGKILRFQIGNREG